MRLVEFLCGAKRSDKGAVTHMRTDVILQSTRNIPIVAGDNHTAGTGLFAFFNVVNLIQSLALVGSFELLSKVVVSDTAGVYDRVWWENVLHRERNSHVSELDPDTQSQNNPQQHLVQRSEQHHPQRM